MSQEIIEHNSHNNDEIVLTSDNQPVSMKLIQSIYNEITGKTENISKIFRENHEVCFEDINQLNAKINQLYEQYNIVSKNCYVIVYHIDDQKQQFSSFERFSLFDKSTISACENIRITYEFLILLPATQKIQPYKIEIDIHSRAAVRKRATTSSEIPRALLRLVSIRSAYIEIEFIDYNVARNFLTAIENWYASIPKNKSPYILEKLKDHSDDAPFIFRNVTAASLIIYFSTHRENLLGNPASIDSLFLACLIAFGLIFIATSVTQSFGKSFGFAIDSYQPISSLKLNRGDDIAINESKKLNKKTLLLMIVSTAATIFVNITSTVIAKSIGL